MQLPIYIKKTGETITVSTFDLVNGNEIAAAQLDLMLANCKPVAYAIAYGLTQSVNDAHAALTRAVDGTEKVMAAAQKKLNAILAGTVKVRGAARTHADPVMHEATKLANKWWKGKGDGGQNAAIGKIRAKGGRFDDMNDSDIIEIILASFAQSDATQAKAQAIVDANALTADEDFDLDEIGLDEESDE